MSEAKIAGVCAGFARYFGLDVTLVRILWVVLTVFPVPFFGLISYIVAWIVMPKDPVTAAGHACPSRTSAAGFSTSSNQSGRFSTSRGLLPSGGPMMPSCCIMSRMRAARP